MRKINFLDREDWCEIVLLSVNIIPHTLRRGLSLSFLLFQTGHWKCHFKKTYFVISFCKSQCCLEKKYWIWSQSLDPHSGLSVTYLILYKSYTFSGTQVHFWALSRIVCADSFLILWTTPLTSLCKWETALSNLQACQASAFPVILALS